MKTLHIFLIFTLLISLNTLNATEVENLDLKIRLKPRTPNQMAAFYEARGFPQSMINKLNHVCFFTIGIKNKSKTILRHDLTKWKFTSDGKPIERFERKYWKTMWKSMQIPMASQSTFRWTLMPEQLDFHPQESEGGNITLPRGPLNYDIEAAFQIGADKTVPLVIVELKDIQCAEDKAATQP